MLPEEDLKRARSLKTKYEQERALGNWGPPEAESRHDAGDSEARKKAERERVRKLAARSAGRVLVSPGVRVLAMVQVFLAGFLLIIAYSFHTHPQSDLSSMTTSESLLIISGGFDGGVIENMHPDLGVSHLPMSVQSPLLADAKNVGQATLAPNLYWLLCLGALRLLLGLGIWIGNRFSYLTLGALGVLNAAAFVLLMAVCSFGHNLLELRVALDGPSSVVCLLLNAVTAYALFRGAAEAGKRHPLPIVTPAVSNT
jgi:hypothetical protein